MSQPTALDRKPDGDLSSLRNVHVTYAVPADATSRFATLASAIATDTAAIDAWWRREDPSRAPRYDLFAFPGCTSKFGSLDIGFVRLPQNGIEYTGDSGADSLLSDLPAIESLTSQKHVVYYDGPVPFGDQVCGTAFVPRSATTQGGFSGIAFVWLASLCGGDVGAGRLNAAVAVHELIHGLAALQGSVAERVRAPQRRPRLRQPDRRPLSGGEQPDDAVHADSRQRARRLLRPFRKLVRRAGLRLALAPAAAAALGRRSNARARREAPFA